MTASPWLTRHQHRPPLKQILTGALGAAITIGLLHLLSNETDPTLLAASLGSSCVLVYSLPGSLMAQPANVVGGHLTGTVCGLAVATVTPLAWWSTAAALGLALTVMALLRITHAPAGATVIIVCTTHPSWTYLFVPILAGTVFVVVFASLLLRLDGITYPARSVQQPLLATSSAQGAPGDPHAR